MRDIKQVQSKNEVNIVGKLLSVQTRSGKTGAGVPYESVTALVRVNQDIEGKSEVHEIQESIFASPYTNTGKANPIWENVKRLKEMKTAENVGIDEADVVRLTKGNIQENYYVARNGQAYDTWQIRGAFVGKGGEKTTSLATFNVEIVIIDMRDEVNNDGDPTGRMIIKGGIVQYGGKLDIVDFIVEAPDKVDYLQRNWEVNKTVRANGRIRVTVQEEAAPTKTSSWGEVVPESSARIIRELIITGGDDEPLDDEFAYNYMDIKKAANERKALMEQKQIEAKNSSSPSKTSPAKAGNYDWE